MTAHPLPGFAQAETQLLDELSPEAPAVTLATRDGRSLEGSLFVARGPVRGTVMINAGTGIPRHFYAAFARHLASRGFATLTYDYRGIGGSRGKTLRGDDATKRHWGREDFSAAFAWLEARFPGVPRFVVGHSVGGQLLGLMERPEAIDGVVTVATSFGYWRNMPAPYRWFVATMWYLAIPFFTRFFGYVPAKRLGLGEDLPSGVGRDWARWGKRADYFVGELGEEPGFRTLRAPWKALYLSDDRIATSTNAEPMLACYPNAAIDVQTLAPEDYGYDAIGHLAFFSRKRRRLWAEVSDWLDARA